MYNDNFIELVDMYVQIHILAIIYKTYNTHLGIFLMTNLISR